LRRYRGRGLLAITLVCALVGAGVVAIATSRVVLASPVVVDTGTSMAETASTNFKFDTCTFEMLPTGVMIALTFFDADTTSAHSFTIIKEPNYQIPSSADLWTLIRTNGTLVNTYAQPGGWGNNTSTTTTVSFMAPATAGWYEFVCLEAGHFQAGMFGFIAFGENLPAGLGCASGTPGPGLAVFIIIGTIVTLTVLAIVLGFVIGRREGSTYEMPPERLGYPEPPTTAPQPPVDPLLKNPPGPPSRP
jgi:hypothetical protein